MNDPVYHLWESERAALEEFYQRLSQWKQDASFLPKVPFAQAEPWQQGLYEAVAFFAARTRLATTNNVTSMWERLLAEHAAPLLRPLPTLGLLQIQPAAGLLAKPMDVPRGAELHVRRPGARVATFRTECNLTVRDLVVDCKGLAQNRNGQLYLDLGLRCSAPFHKGQRIRLHLRVRNDTLSALQVLDALRRTLCAATLLTATGEPLAGCRVSLGAEAQQTPCADTQDHPVSQVRYSFHQPERELFLHVVPDADVPPPGAVLRLVLDGAALPVATEGLLRRQAVEFLPNVVPISNLHRMQIQLPIYDGTRDQLPVLHPLTDREFAPHEILGLYERKGAVLTPLPRGVLPNPESSGQAPVARGYDVVHGLSPDGMPRVLLNLTIPDAWQQPVALVADVLWYQPWLHDEVLQGVAGEPKGLANFGFGPASEQPFTVEMSTHYVRDARHQLIGNLAPNLDNPLRRQSGELWRLAELRSREQLKTEDLRTLLRALGVLPHSVYRTLPRHIQQLTGTRAQVASAGGMRAQQDYQLQLATVEEWEGALLAGFVGLLRRLLDAYSPDPVSLEVTVGGEPWQPPPGGP